MELGPLDVQWAPHGSCDKAFKTWTNGGHWYQWNDFFVTWSWWRAKFQ